MTEPELNVSLDDLSDAQADGFITADELASSFAAWATQSGRPLYSHQEEAMLEILSGNHVIVSTPTGSGKSLIAVAAHLHSLSKDQRTFYSAPLKALVSEKFFDLVALFGAANVGMITGDVSLNAGAPIICCTAEILANAALREGADFDVHTVVMDEFHFYADPQRGWAWQIPLLELPQAQFVLMSATLGPVDFFCEDLLRRTGRQVAVIADAPRPVPLEMEYSLEPLHELAQRVVQQGKSPAYIVHFTQKDAVETARALTSINVASKEKKAAIVSAIGDFKFGTGFGAIISSLLRNGIGVHHAGMLPRYRRLVERLAQKGLLPVICGTDTLGVGINVPIHTVVFTGLTKFDGKEYRHLSAREFHQIAGRAGRAGFDTEGYVVVQAPEHVIENAAALAKAGDDERKRKKIVRKKAPEGKVNWTDKTFERLESSGPEPLTSQFQLTHSMVLSVFARPGDPATNLKDLCTNNHEPEREENPHLLRLEEILQSLLDAQVIALVDAGAAEAGAGTEAAEAEQAAGTAGTGTNTEGTNTQAVDENASTAVTNVIPLSDQQLKLLAELPEDFALNAPLSPFALAALDLLDKDSPDFLLDTVSVIEATLEDPRPLLYAQQKAEKDVAMAGFKAEGMGYEERMNALDDITWPQPLAELLSAAFSIYRQTNPWVDDYELSPKSVVRFMIENAMTFSDLISRFGLARSEGVILRYITDAYRALKQTVPETHRTEEFNQLLAWLDQLIRAVDSSLLDEWVRLESAQANGGSLALPTAAGAASSPTAATSPGEAGAETVFGAGEGTSFSANKHAFRVALRNAAFARVELAARDECSRLASLPGSGLDTNSWDIALGEYWDEFDWIGTTAAARAASLCHIDLNPTPTDLDLAAVTWAELSTNQEHPLPQFPSVGVGLIRQVILDPEETGDWRLLAWFSPAECDSAGQAILHVYSFGPH